MHRVCELSGAISRGCCACDRSQRLASPSTAVTQWRQHATVRHHEHDRMPCLSGLLHQRLPGRRPRASTRRHAEGAHRRRRLHLSNKPRATEDLTDSTSASAIWQCSRCVIHLHDCTVAGPRKEEAPQPGSQSRTPVQSRQGRLQPRQGDTLYRLQLAKAVSVRMTCISLCLWVRTSAASRAASLAPTRPTL